MKPVIFFDLDGVLADFVAGAMKTHGKEIPYRDVVWGLEDQLGFKDNPAAFWEPFGFDFWAGLGVYPDGLCLLKFAERRVGPESIALLTSPCDTPGCSDGKRAWVAKHLPDYRRRLFLGSAKHLFAGPQKILVDDHDANVDAFAKAGGLAVQPARPWNRHKPSTDATGAFDVTEVAQALAVALDRAEIPRAKVR